MGNKEVGSGETYVLAVVGAGVGAATILKKARELDYVKTLAFGQEDSSARGLADEFVVCDVNDIERMVSICRERHADGVIGPSENVTEIAAVVAHRLLLPGNSIEGGFAGRNKYVMRQRVSAVDDIKQPSFSLYEESKDVCFPVVVKALDACGKKGLTLARDSESLKKAVAYARLHSTDGRVLIEEYLEGGQEYSIECLSSNGTHEIIQYTEKVSSGAPHFVELGHHQPAMLSPLVKAKIDQAVPKVLEVLGIQCGMSHFELKVIGDEVYFIEVGARGGGDCISDVLTFHSTGFDYLKAAIDCSLGIYEHRDVGQVAHTGLYYHCQQNADLQPLFKAAETAGWCLVNAVRGHGFAEAIDNETAFQAGFIIYKSDHRITIEDAYEE